MLVEKIEKTKKGMYKITVLGKEYLFSEDTIVEYRMTLGHETNEEELKNALKREELQSFYSKACSYQIRYAKGEAKVREYLKNKEVSQEGINQLIDKMKKNKILNDNDLIDSIILSLSRKGNGKALIKEKLYQRGFYKKDIEERMEYMDMEEYKNGLIKLYQKVSHKYDKYDPYIKKEKLKAYLLSRGYTYSEIVFLF